MPLCFYFAFQISPLVGTGERGRLRTLLEGYELLVTAALSMVLEVGLYALILLCPSVFSGSRSLPGANLLLFFPAVLLLIANGFLRILLTSERLRTLWRVLLLTLWWFPLLNIFIFAKIFRVVKSEYRYEAAKSDLTEVSTESDRCKTKYPIVLVHGIFFRDWNKMNYWGRIPRELRRNGADLYYGSQQSAKAVASSAGELKEQILQVLAKTGAEKVNMIAHSKGGLDSRYAISCLGLAPYVASLTTISVPHYGCTFAQTLLNKTPEKLLEKIAERYNRAYQTLGDREPDFLAGVRDLTADHCAALNRAAPNMAGVFYQSVMSRMKSASGAGAPLNFTYWLVKKHDKEPNDGLVSVSSAVWGNFLGTLESSGKRGISHCDVIDLLREDIPGFDVRKFYVGLVMGLKAKGF
ncbi:MAG: triacylglycerol lipase [Oscillospiraceae bacterium]